MRGYLFQRLHETRSYSPEKPETVFLNPKNLIFSVGAGSILFAFCFGQNIFKYEFKIPVFMGVEGILGRES